MRAWLLAFIALAACGGTPSDEPGTSSASGGPSVDTGHKPAQKMPPNVVGSFSIQLPKVTLKPGAETFPCYVFPLKVTGASHIVGGGKVIASPGMHHGNITTRKSTVTFGPNDTVLPCPKEEQSAFGGEGQDIAGGGAVLFASSTQVQGEEWSSFPDGMGFPIASSGYEIIARMHYLNTSSTPLEVTAKYDWYTVDPAKITQLLGPFAWVLRNWTIPPNSDYTAATECKIPVGDTLGDMNIVNAMPHMHALATGFFAEHVGGPLDGQRFLDSKGYDPGNGVITQYDPAAKLAGGEAVRFGCAWHNTYDQDIVWGTGKNEMCILFGYAYPYTHAYSTAANEAACLFVAPPDPPK
jgi:hypothetical protein